MADETKEIVEGEVNDSKPRKKPGPKPKQKAPVEPAVEAEPVTDVPSSEPESTDTDDTVEVKSGSEGTSGGAVEKEAVSSSEAALDTQVDSEPTSEVLCSGETTIPYVALPKSFIPRRPIILHKYPKDKCKTFVIAGALQVVSSELQNGFVQLRGLATGYGPVTGWVKEDEVRKLL